MDDYLSESLCLVPHNSDVTFHTVSIEKITAPTTVKRVRSFIPLRLAAPTEADRL